MNDSATHFDAPDHDPETCGWYECRHEREKRQLRARVEYLGSVLSAIAFDLGQRVPLDITQDDMDFDGLVNIHKVGAQLKAASEGNTRMAMLLAAGACAAVSSGLTHYDNILNVVAASESEHPERWGIPDERGIP
jgi:hypothetical protein